MRRSWVAVGIAVALTAAVLVSVRPGDAELGAPAAGPSVLPSSWVLVAPPAPTLSGPPDSAPGTPVQTPPGAPPPAPAVAPPAPAVSPGSPAGRPARTRPRVRSTPPVRPPVRIMPLGDSITAGSGSRTRDGYRRPLAVSLTAAGVRFDFVGSLTAGTGTDNHHEGHRGWRIDQLQARIRDWLATSRPDVVLLDIGTNDVWQDFQQDQAPARLSALLDTILSSAPNRHVVVAKIGVAGGPRRAALAAGQRAFNRAIPGIVAAKGPRASLADMTPVPWTNTTDGVHPNDLGYRQMAYQWYQALRRVPVLRTAVAREIADPFPGPGNR